MKKTKDSKVVVKQGNEKNAKKEESKNKSNDKPDKVGKKGEKDDISIRSKSAVFIHIKDHFFVSEFHAVQPRQIPGNFRRQKRSFVRSRRR